MTRAFRAAAVVVLVAASLPWAASLTRPPAAGAQREPSRQATLRLASQTPWVGLGQEYVLRLVAAAPAPEAAEVAVTVYQRVTSRSAFTRTLEGAVRGSPLVVAAAPLAELTPDAAGAVTVRIPLQDPGQPRQPGRLALAREGVYPVRVELRELDGGESFADMTTHLLHVPAPAAGEPLAFAPVLPVHARPSVQPDASRVTSPSGTGGLGAVARSLEGHPTVPIVLWPTPETVEGLVASGTEDRDVVAALARGLRGRQVVAAPYVPVNPAQLLRHDLEDELAAQRALGDEVLASALGVRADPRTWVVDRRLDEETLAYFRRQQIDRVVVPEQYLQPIGLGVTLARPFTLEGRPAGRRTIQAVAADNGLARHFGRAPDPVLAAHQLLAELAVIYYDNPGAPRGVTAVAPRSWRPDARFLDVLLEGLESGTVVRGSTLDRIFTGVPTATTNRGRVLVRRPAARGDLAPFPADDVRAARRRLEAFGALVEPGNPVFEGLDRVLLVGESSEVAGSSRRAYVAGVGRALDAELAKIEMPANRSITLTAKRGEIPITIQSGVGYPIRAQLRVDSDKLEFPGGATRRVELSLQNTTERFAVRARSSGSFPLRVRLESPDGRLVLGRTLFTVRSTAVSGVGVFISVGAVAFLVVWWARHLRRARRRDTAAQ